MIEILSQADTQLFLFLNSFHTPALDRFMMLVSDRFVWVPMYIIIFAITTRRYGLRGGVLCAIGATIAIALADQTCATLLRPWIQRLRPSNLDNPISALVHVVNGYRGGPCGMPSCHAANTFAAATFLSLIFRQRRDVKLFLLAWAIFVCYSRVYLGVHYPGDLLCGAIIGSLAGIIAFALTRHAGLWLYHRHLEPRHDTIIISVARTLPQFAVAAPSVIWGSGLLTATTLLIMSLVAYFL